MSTASKNRVVEAHWRQVELPVVDEACPTKCLAMGRNLPWLPRPLDCVSCSLYVLIYPANDLELKAGE